MEKQMAASSNKPMPKMFSTVLTNIGIGIANGRSEDGKQVLVGFHRSNLSEEWLQEHQEYKGNPMLWVNLEDIQQDFGISSDIAQSIKRTKRSKAK